MKLASLRGMSHSGIMARLGQRLATVTARGCTVLVTAGTDDERLA
jgi:hypothetical protein